MVAGPPMEVGNRFAYAIARDSLAHQICGGGLPDGNFPPGSRESETGANVDYDQRKKFPHRLRRGLAFRFTQSLCKIKRASASRPAAGDHFTRRSIRFTSQRG